MHSMPQEVEVWYVIPAIRKEFVIEMKRRGLKQSEIADKLGVTRAAVSQYLSGKRASDVKFSNDIKKEIKKSVDKIMKGCCCIKEIQCICNCLKKKGSLCKIHKKLDKKIKCCGGCFS